MNHRDDFTAHALAGELDLTKLSSALGFPVRYRWEEPMVLDPATLKPAARTGTEFRVCYLYYFGALVFVNCDRDTIQGFFTKMSAYSEQFRKVPGQLYTERYALESGAQGSPAITNDGAVMAGTDPVFRDIIAFVLAKSVGLERIETGVEQLLDEIEGLITLLDRGKLGIGDRKLARLASSILNFKYTSIACIMVLDKPDVTWENPEADRLYLTLANFFELNQRYQGIKAKSDTLMDVTQVFTGLSHARRATKLEWIIILLIALEIVIFLAEKI